MSDRRETASAGLWVWPVVGVACFHLAWLRPEGCWALPGFVLGLARLAALPTPRLAFYGALGVGFACYGPHLGFFWTIFGPAAVLLWGLLAIWPALFVVMLRAVERRWGRWVACMALPVLWTGLEYFRSELWPLRFSWLALGYAFSESPQLLNTTRLGVYGLGFAVASGAALAWVAPRRWRMAVLAGVMLVGATAVNRWPERSPGFAPDRRALTAVGLQLEYPCEDELLRSLEDLAARNPNAPLVVLSEYSLQGPPTPELQEWCRRHQRHLVLGGKDPVGAADYYNTAFVVGPGGDVEFRQAKSVPIQFFEDGLPAAGQSVWGSPWGRLGLAVCYDLSYRRVMDPLVILGAEGWVVPAADDLSWGRYQHELHARVARVRAAEYRLPVLRVAGSGISQYVDGCGRERASAPFLGLGEVMEARLELGGPGVVPWDRVGAPAAVALTGVIALGLFVPTGKRIARGRGLAQFGVRIV
jgi:apolipoprotein N-acyltransferase